MPQSKTDEQTDRQGHPPIHTYIHLSPAVSAPLMVSQKDKCRICKMPSGSLCAFPCGGHSFRVPEVKDTNGCRLIIWAKEKFHIKRTKCLTTEQFFLSILYAEAEICLATLNPPTMGTRGLYRVTVPLRHME